MWKLHNNPRDDSDEVADCDNKNSDASDDSDWENNGSNDDNWNTIRSATKMIISAWFVFRI